MSDQLALGADDWLVERSSDNRFYYAEAAEVIWTRDRSQAAVFDEERAKALAVDLSHSLDDQGIKAVPAREEPEDPLLERLAKELAWKLLHPQQLAEGSIYALMDYRELTGADCPQVVVDAIERIRGREP